MKTGAAKNVVKLLCLVKKLLFTLLGVELKSELPRKAAP